MSIVETLAEFVVETNFEKIPVEAVAVAKSATIDTVGVTLAGSLDPAGKAIVSFVRKSGSPGLAGVIGSKFCSSSSLAALANGTMAHALDYDDTGAYTQGHPSAILVPVVLSLGHELNAPGRRLIEAYVLGVEVWAKVSRGMPGLYETGWHPTPVLGTIGAAVAAAKLVGLDAKQTANAIGIACSEAAGLGQNMGTMTKPFHAGNAARSGIVAAMLAAEGFTSANDIFEGEMGFPKVFRGGSGVNVAKMVQGLGSPFTLVGRGINVKRYPSCMGTHRAIDAMLHLIDTHGIKPEQVEKVYVNASPRGKKIVFHDNAVTGYQGKFSMPFVMAASLRDQKVELAQFTDQTVNDPEIRDLMKRVVFRVHPDWVEGKDTETRDDVVVTRLKDGREYSCGVANAKGHAKVPLTHEEVQAKYRECANLVLGPQEVEKCLRLIENLENLDSVKELMSILVS